MNSRDESMTSLLRRTAIVILAVVTGGILVLGGANTARAQDSEPVENPFFDRSPQQVYTEEAEGNLRVGLGEADITPTWPVQLPYGADSKTGESYGKTKVKALLLEVSGKKFVILGYDLIGIEKKESEHIKKRVSEKSKIDKRNIIVSATHNHSYPRMTNNRVRDLVTRKSIEAVEDASESIFSGRIGVNKKNVREDISLNRAELNGEANTRLYVMKIEDEEGNLRGVHYNFGVHPTIFTEWGSTQGKIGPEWPGYVNAYVSMRKKLDLMYRKYEEKGSHVVEPWIMFSQGAAGDQEPRRADVRILGKREAGSKVFAEKLAWEVIDLIEQTETRSNVNLRMRSKTIDLRREGGDEYRTLLQSLSINNSLIATIPGELNVGLARDFIRESPFQNNLLVTIAGDYVGYIVQDHLAWERVTYQAKSVGFEPHYAERIIDESLKLADPTHQVRPKRNPDTVLGSLSGTIDYDGEHTVAVGAKRMPSGPNYAGGFWGRRTVIDEDGNWKIDDLAPGQLYLYVVETDDQQPRPTEFKSGFDDIRDLVVGYPVRVAPQEKKKNINFDIGEGYMETEIESLDLNTSSFEVQEYTLSGRIEVNGHAAYDEEVVVGVYPARLMYRSLNSYLRDPMLTTTAEEEGEFTFDSLPPGRYRVVSYVDINENGLQEGIDLHTRPEDSPVVSIGGALNRNFVDDPYRGHSTVMFDEK
jgi:hypothetical protein